MKRITLMLLILAVAQDASAQSGEPVRAGAFKETAAVRRGQERDLQSMLDSQRERNDQLAERVRQLERENRELRGTVGSLQKQKHGLFELLERQAAYEISEIYVNEVFPTDRSVTVELGTDQVGRVGAALYSGEERIATYDPPVDLAKIHTISFDGQIYPQRNYRIEAIPVDRAGKPLPVGSVLITQQDLRKLSFTSPAPVQPPAVTMLPKKEGDEESDQILVRFRVDKESLVTIECEHQVPGILPGLHDWEKCTGKGYFEPARGLSGPSGDLRAAPHKDHIVEMQNLRPDTNYKFTVLAHDTRFGHRSMEPKSHPNYRTTPPHPPFGFDGPFVLTFGPEALEVSWKATEAPKEARLKLVLGASTTLEEVATVDGSTVKVSIPHQNILTVLRGEKGERKTLPQLRAEMTSGKAEKAQMELLVGITLPNDQKGVDARVSRLLKSFLKAIEESPDPLGERFSWRDLAVVVLTLLTAG